LQIIFADCQIGNHLNHISPRGKVLFAARGRTERLALRNELIQRTAPKELPCESFEAKLAGDSMPNAAMGSRDELELSPVMIDVCCRHQLRR
jgi:hypothetical protein